MTELAILNENNLTATSNPNVNVLQNSNNGEIGLTEQQMNVLKSFLAKEATIEELQLYMFTAQRLGLDPFARQIYLIKRWSATEQKKVATIQISIDGFRCIAAKNPDYAGQTEILYCGKDGKWVEVWTGDPKKGEYPFAAKVGVYRRGYEQPTYAVAKWDSYAQLDKDGKVTSMWHKFPDLMLGKCGEALALRKSFPSLGGLYIPEEMQQAEYLEANIAETPAIEQKKNTKYLNNSNKSNTNNALQFKAKAPVTNAPAANQNQKTAAQIDNVAHSVTPAINKNNNSKIIDATTVETVAQVASAQQPQTQPQQPTLELNDDEYDPNKAQHKMLFKSFFNSLSLVDNIWSNSELTDEAKKVELGKICKDFSEKSKGMPLKYIKEHLLNLEEALNYQKKTQGLINKLATLK